MDDTDRHPTAAEIVDFRIGGAGSDSSRGIGAHVAGCDRCHAVYLGVLSLENGITAALVEGARGAACPEEWEIAAAVSGEMGGDGATRVLSHLKGCAHCIDLAACCYKSLAADRPVPSAPEAWRNEAVAALAAGPRKPGEVRAGILEWLREFVRGLSAALPPLPGYAAAAALVVLTILLYTGDRKKAIVIPPTEKIVIRDALPARSLGFMDEEAPPVPAKSVVLRSSGNRVIFRWEPPAGYSAYSFALVERPGATVLWRQSAVAGGEVVVPGDLLSGDRVYGWLIEVTLADGRTLEYTGDFLYRR